MDQLLLGLVTLKTLLFLFGMLVLGWAMLCVGAYFINRHWRRMIHQDDPPLRQPPPRCRGDLPPCP